MTLTHTYQELPERFFERSAPAAVKTPRLQKFNTQLADELQLNLEDESADSLAKLFSGNQLREDMQPIAQAYAGHQFGSFVPQLGDGRALLLGETTTKGGTRFDIQLKGSGRTPFSRMGDGRAPLGPVMREYILSEAMHALGVPTTRSLAIVTTGETVIRDTIEPGAILTRVASSHIRVGTFEYFAAREDTEALQALLDYAIERHYSDLADADEKPLAFLKAVSEAQAKLVAQWTSLGFIHGVMNTDNTTISGETIDYGPCAFMEGYDPNAVFSYIDEMGRYAYGNQGPIAQWNLACLAECLLPLMPEAREKAREKTEVIIRDFQSRFMEHWLVLMGRKIGLTDPKAADIELIQGWLELMQKHQLDFTLTFRQLASEETLPKALLEDAEWSSWRKQWHARLDDAKAEAKATMLAANPAYIPRNHLVQRAIDAAQEGADFSVLESLLEALERPYETHEKFADYAKPAPREEVVYQTFCGT